MSLDVYAKIDDRKILEGKQYGTSYYYWSRDERETIQYLTDTVLWINITHNLGDMASHVPIEFYDDCGNYYKTDLYHIMWRPEEVFVNKENIKLADVREPIEIGLKYVLSNEEELSKYNPENGWGHYDNFVYCLPEYIRACYKYPNATITISR
jgi:hypothetical protein